VHQIKTYDNIIELHMEVIDILTILIICIIVVAIITINFDTTLDKKFSNISVNIPPITVPDPNITIKIQKSCDSEEYTIITEKGGSSTMSISPIVSKSEETIGSSESIPKTENFSVADVSNAASNMTSQVGSSASSAIQNTRAILNDANVLINQASNVVQPYTQKLDKTVEVAAQPLVKTIADISKPPKQNNYDTTPKPTVDATTALIPTTVKSVKFPDADNVVPYGDYIPKPKQEELLVDKNGFQSLSTNKCNASLRDKRIDAVGYMMKNRYGVNSNNNGCNYLHDDIDELNFDPNTYYKKFQTYVERHLEDPKMRGYNVGAFDSYGGLRNIGRINLTSDIKYPKPVGYVFENTPTYTK
jgi:hypothetical protein